VRVREGKKRERRGERKERKEKEERGWSLHCGDGVEDFVEFEFVEDGGLSGIIKAQHQDPGLHAEVGVDKLGEEVAHLSCLGLSLSLLPCTCPYFRSSL